MAQATVGHKDSGHRQASQAIRLPLTCPARTWAGQASGRPAEAPAHGGIAGELLLEERDNGRVLAASGDERPPPPLPEDPPTTGWAHSPASWSQVPRVPWGPPSTAISIPCVVIPENR